MNKLQAGTIHTSQVMVCQVHAIVKAIRPLFISKCLSMRPESKLICSKICPKYLQEFPKIFTYYALQCSPLCLHYAPRLATFLHLSWNILTSECSIRVFH